MGGCSRPTAKNPANAVYVCTALDCAGTARNVRDVDSCLQEIVLSLLDVRHRTVASEPPEWPGAPLLHLLAEERASLEEQFRTGGLTDADSSQKTSDLDARISGLEAAREAHRRNQQTAAADWNPSRWSAMSLAQRRAAIAKVLESVTVLPLPAGRSRRAPFDPGLLRINPVGDA
ncbi:hypothetical protein [Streptomyces sp. NPDC002845]